MTWKKTDELYSIMDELGIKDYRTDILKPPGSENAKYGIWVEFSKPEANGSFFIEANKKRTLRIQKMGHREFYRQRSLLDSFSQNSKP